MRISVQRGIQGFAAMLLVFWKDLDLTRIRSDRLSAEAMMNKPLSTLDLIVLVAYLGGITIVGMRVSRRVKDERFKQLTCLELRGLFLEHYRCH